jgi:ribosomal-protein-alanine N-acetyltransferase
MTANAAQTALMPRELRTLRLLVRPIKLSDVEDVLAYSSNPNWARFLPVPWPYTESDAEEFVASARLADWESRPQWALERDGHMIGAINLNIEPQHRKAMLGYALGEAHRGQGLVFEAARELVTVAFHCLPTLNRIWAMADVRNVASQRVLEKLGMRREGVLRQNSVTRGEVCDDAYYAVLRSEWTH